MLVMKLIGLYLVDADGVFRFHYAVRLVVWLTMERFDHRLFSGEAMARSERRRVEFMLGLRVGAPWNNCSLR